MDPTSTPPAAAPATKPQADIWQELEQTIIADAKAFVAKAETVGAEVATIAYNDVKQLFDAAGADQYKIVRDLVKEASADETAGDGIEATAADVLTLAEQKEMAWVAQIPAELLTAFIALAKRSLKLTGS